MIADQEIADFFAEEEEADELVEVGVTVLKMGGEIVQIEFEDLDGEFQMATLLRGPQNVGDPVEIPADRRVGRVLSIHVMRNPDA